MLSPQSTRLTAPPMQMSQPSWCHAYTSLVLCVLGYAAAQAVAIVTVMDALLTFSNPDTGFPVSSRDILHYVAADVAFAIAFIVAFAKWPTLPLPVTLAWTAAGAGLAVWGVVIETRLPDVAPATLKKGLLGCSFLQFAGAFFATVMSCWFKGKKDSSEQQRRRDHVSNLSAPLLPIDTR